MAGTEAVASASAPSPEVASVADVDENSSQPSPTTSDKTVIISSAHCSKAPVTPQERQMPKAPQISPIMCGGQDQAVFSTDMGRLAWHPPHKALPLVVRSDKIKGVVDSARYWREKYPEQSLCFFPECGYTIQDVWDGHDICIDTAEFLHEVLQFIMRENVYRARSYAEAWSAKNRDRLDIIGGDMTGIYDPANPLAIVDKIFVNGEANEFPRPFLWHVANIMRTGMRNASLKQRAVPTALNAKSTDTLEHTPKDAAEEKQIPTPGSAIRKTNRKMHRPTRKKELTECPEVIPLAQASVIVPGLPPTVRPSTAEPQGTNLPIIPVQLPKIYPNLQPSFVEGQQALLPPPPFVNPPNMGIQKGRGSRAGSTSYNRSIAHRPWGENYPGQPMPGNQSRQLSGPLSAMQSPRYVPAVPIGQPPMMNPVNNIGPYHQGFTIMSPQMAPAQMNYGSIMHPGMLPPQTGPFGSRLPLEFGQPNYSSGPPIAQGMHMGDPSNTPNYQYNPLPQHMIDQRTSINLRPNQNSKPGLYNPYGADKPEFSQIPSNPIGRKMPRNPSFNTTDRGRKMSAGNSKRPSYGQSQNSQRVDSNASFHGNRSVEAQGSKKVSADYFSYTLDPTVTQDLDLGCGEHWIGPQNNYVNYLWVSNLPRNPDPSSQELKRMFETCAGVSVTSVRIQSDKYNAPFAYVK